MAARGLPCAPAVAQVQFWVLPRLRGGPGSPICPYLDSGSQAGRRPEPLGSSPWGGDAQAGLSGQHGPFLLQTGCPGVGLHVGHSCCWLIPSP